MINYDGLFRLTLRIESTFQDDLGNPPKSGSGSGICIRHNDEFLFITSRHMVNRENIGKEKLIELYLWCRTEENLQVAPQKFKVDLSQTNIIHHSTADVAIVVDPKFVFNHQVAKPICNTLETNDDLFADEKFFTEHLIVTESCVFVGYPALKYSDPWWDTGLGLPIARMANIASYPKEDFSNASVGSTHARLVSGLSFTGSSGSPIMNVGFQMKTKKGVEIMIPETMPPTIMGIMGGHWQERMPEMFAHTGISYFVTSLAIRELLSSLSSN